MTRNPLAKYKTPIKLLQLLTELLLKPIMVLNLGLTKKLTRFEYENNFLIIYQSSLVCFPYVKNSLLFLENLKCLGKYRGTKKRVIK